MPEPAIPHPWVPLLFMVLASCGAPRGSTVSYAGLRETWRAQFFVVGRTVAVRALNPPGRALVVWGPRVEGGDVVFNAGVASAGGGGERIQCFRVEAHARLFWREPDGRRTSVTAAIDDAEARSVVARCPR